MGRSGYHKVTEATSDREQLAVIIDGGGNNKSTKSGRREVFIEDDGRHDNRFVS